MNESIVAVPVAGEFRVDSRTMAVRLDNKHKNVVALIEEYNAEFSALGVLAFETEKPLEGSTGGRPIRYAYLNEDQCYFLLTLVRNTAQVVGLKLALVQAFGKVRRLAAGAASAPTPTPPTPLLISARLIGESTGQTRNAAINQLKRYSDIQPVAHFLEPQRHGPSFLYPLAEVQAYLTERGWALAAPLQAFTGKVLPGLPKKKALPRAKAAPASIPLFVPLSEAEQLGAQLARELTEEFIRTELPKRLRALLTIGALA